MSRPSVAHCLDLASCIPEERDNWQIVRELRRELQDLLKREEQTK